MYKPRFVISLICVCVCVCVRACVRMCVIFLCNPSLEIKFAQQNLFYSVHTESVQSNATDFSSFLFYLFIMFHVQIILPLFLSFFSVTYLANATNNKSHKCPSSNSTESATSINFSKSLHDLFYLISVILFFREKIRSLLDTVHLTC